MLLLTQVLTQTTQTTTIFSAPKRHKYNTALIKLSQNTLFLSSILDLHTQFMLHWTPLNIINIIYINSSSRRVQLFESGADLQERVFLLSHHHLCSMLYVSHSLMGQVRIQSHHLNLFISRLILKFQFLAWPACYPCSSVPGCDHTADHVHPDQRHLSSASSGLIHQGYWCVDRSMSGMNHHQASMQARTIL